jgi:nitroimidazol reductase NimA-like FMN-containing flavoprotein (pyridoxamine 5'-phosphate oxidase superfamily)
MSLEIPKDIQSYLEQSIIPLRLACTTQTGWPIVLSLWYLYENSAIYCATKEAARVVSYLRQEPRCAFEIASDQMPYCGIRCQGLAEVLPSRGDEILRRLLKRYVGGTDNTLARNLLARQEAEVAIKIVPVNLSSWNFQNRMQDVPTQQEKQPRPCPSESIRIDRKQPYS